MNVVAAADREMILYERFSPQQRLAPQSTPPRYQTGFGILSENDEDVET